MHAGAVIGANNYNIPCSGFESSYFQEREELEVELSVNTKRRSINFIRRSII